MDAVQSALWYVEAHLGRGVSLDEVARAVGASPYHLTRAFGAVFGLSLIKYVRRRCLSEAARHLVGGATDILTVALLAGYGSHEAFSRAFKDEFGITPESARALGATDRLDLLEPFVMSSTPLPSINPPRIEVLPTRRFVGLVERYKCADPAGIPGQWQRFSTLSPAISEIVDEAAFGVCFNGDDCVSFDYLTGVIVRPEASAPAGLVHLDLPGQKYAVFRHEGQISEIRGVFAAIWAQGLTSANLEPVSGATLEKYGPEFDPMSGMGGYEIWVAVK
jgi:AraC family transcriptional regulator